MHNADLMECNLKRKSYKPDPATLHNSENDSNISTFKQSKYKVYLTQEEVLQLLFLVRQQHNFAVFRYSFDGVDANIQC